MKKILLLLPTIFLSLNAETIKPKKVKAKDRDSRGHYSSKHHSREDILFSTVEASSQASSQISFEVTLGLSTQATTEVSTEQKIKQRTQALKFTKSNRSKIDIDIAKGGGEHLSSLLNILKLKESKKSLITIQSNFKKLQSLNNQQMIDELMIQII
ncbi:MAG: DUF3015 family protein [Sulfurovaceae bacterium]|nr:DUF3015 family protein [Sulfurovaceae bacterium]